MDFITPEKRSKIMASIRGKDTKPELVVRKLLHRLGYRFRIHRKDLPGKPDICLPKYKTIIFVHGCFWHHHTGCKEGRIPEGNKEFWKKKIERNIERDKASIATLKEMGWKVWVIWECDTKNLDALSNKIVKHLSRASGKKARRTGS